MRISQKQIDPFLGLDLEPKNEAIQATPNSPQESVDELHLLFAGVRSSRQNATAYPQEPISVPSLNEGALQGTLRTSHSPKTLDAAIANYKILKQNLLERRQNLSITLEGYIQPYEALDLFSRIEMIDEALLKIGQNLDRAVEKKSVLEQTQRNQDREIRLEQAAKLAKMEAERKSAEGFDYLVFEEGGVTEDGIQVETRRQA